MLGHHGSAATAITGIRKLNVEEASHIFSVQGSGLGSGSGSVFGFGIGGGFFDTLLFFFPVPSSTTHAPTPHPLPLLFTANRPFRSTSQPMFSCFQFYFFSHFVWSSSALLVPQPVSQLWSLSVSRELLLLLSLSRPTQPFLLPGPKLSECLVPTTN